MEKDRADQIIRWANYVRTSNGKWKAVHTAFINAQFKKANSFYKRLAQQPGGKEIIAELRRIRRMNVAC